MSLEIKVGPPQIAIHHGLTVLVTNPDGQITSPSDMGLYVRDTRLISTWTIFANGEPWELLNGAAITHYASRVFLTNRSFLTEAGPGEDGKIPPRTLSLSIGRIVGDGLHEDLDLTNHGTRTVRFNLEISIRSDFGDIFEVKSNRIVRRGAIGTEWSQAEQCLTTTYRHLSFSRTIAVSTRRAASTGYYANGRITFAIELPPGETWHSCLLYEARDGEEALHAPADCMIADLHREGTSGIGQAVEDWKQAVLKISTSNADFNRLAQQAIEDMAALRLPFPGTDHMQFIPAAGLPWFVALFGRDSLIVSLQNMLVYPTFARGALDVLSAWQATERDDYRDAEPGKIPHELRVGELAKLKLIPHSPYYGTADATLLYPIVLHSLWRATGDRALLDRHLPAAERCLAWIDDYGDRDGDGFQEYGTRSPVGYENQGWKDAEDAVMHADGAKVSGPKALCELQGYTYDAWQRMAEIYDAIGRPERAAELRAKAQALFTRFNEVFWNESIGFYAYALDGEKRQVLSIASNAGHCLWSGIVPPDRAARVVRRLMQPDMWSGWGIRTLSADHPVYNPYSYQNGSVWPHDNAIIALGFKRYGFEREAAMIAEDVSRAASFFTLSQLPELYSGVQRDDANFPVQYLGANVPQAWAAGAVFFLLQALLGFRPDAPHRRLYVDPKLPEWLPDLTVSDLRVGDQLFSIRFERTGKETSFTVLQGDPGAVLRVAHP
jgi:glycogen debranching enzyme